ncbi:MAG: hypothetical protein RBJ76_02520 [Stenomitos frigidus ULC029]
MRLHFFVRQYPAHHAPTDIQNGAVRASLLAFPLTIFGSAGHDQP